MVTLAGILGDHPPTDPDGFLAFARSLHVPDIHEAIRDGEPLDDPVPFRFPASVRHHYERLDRLPDGLLVLGDAVASFNPVYGQGMSVAAIEALTLRRHLESGTQPSPRRWFRDLARVVDVPWDRASGGDLAFPGVPGRRTPKVRFMNAYLDRLLAGAAHDDRLSRGFIRVAGLVDPPHTLLRPHVAARVLRSHSQSCGSDRHPAVGSVGPVVVDEGHGASGSVEEAGGDAGPVPARTVDPDHVVWDIADAVEELVQGDVERGLDV